MGWANQLLEALLAFLEGQPQSPALSRLVDSALSSLEARPGYREAAPDLVAALDSLGSWAGGADLSTQQLKHLVAALPTAVQRYQSWLLTKRRQGLDYLIDLLESDPNANELLLLTSQTL